ncbi:FKBP-type peptidyl-prolyl cis-trans isomerase [Hufsiella ginkgonis]|uniref:peptidylprolyl isomerase n=1 Tax=Hufsiella ginkgonis TaxID=2695274 RepID=A0A7K1Y3Q0_9SPHI|nr:FKBP-type peptidyl-prolyl cis-trans isomerase [Hufsiella ginkgonis]MXV17914.1 peptidylprolyl isomerase [Hufsiella ginkgonis]
MKKQFLLVLVFLFTAVSVMAQDVTRSPSGARFRIAKAGTGPKIKIDDIVTFNFVQKNGKDSVLMSSYQAGRPVKIKIQASKNIGDLMDVFTMLSLKDSAIVYIPTDSIFQGHDDQRPPFLTKGSDLVFNIKIERIQTLDEAIAENNRAIDSLKSQEKVDLNTYLANKRFANLKTTPSGLMYGITTPSLKPKPVAGDTVYVNYVGRTLAGKVFDTSIEAEAKKAGLIQPGRPYEPISFPLGSQAVIPGWEEGLMLMNSGSKGYFIIPSNLAYGEQGSGEDIKPYSTLFFEIELVKVARPVRAAAAKPAVKKPATTPAKKPVTTPKKPAAPVKKPVTKKS